MRNFSDFSKFTDFRNHKLVIELNNPKVGLRGFIAIHDDTLGPAVGGTRMHPYKSENEAIADVLRLSHSMTYKSAIAGMPFGGGKAVIISDPKKGKTKELLLAYAEEINSLKGQFYTGEDVGLSEDDVEIMLSTSPYLLGRRNLAGDPSPFAALSTLIAMKSACNIVFSSPNLLHRRVAVKGVGKVGLRLVELLDQEGADVVAADIDPIAIAKLTKRVPRVKIVNSDIIHLQGSDIYAPCALGKEFTLESVDEIRSKIICGAANNQLDTTQVGQKLFDRGIIYIPDYVANSGGLINVVDELNPKGYSSSRVRSEIEKVYALVTKILSISVSEATPPGQISDMIAEEVLRSPTSRAFVKDYANQ